MRIYTKPWNGRRKINLNRSCVMGSKVCCRKVKLTIKLKQQWNHRNRSWSKSLLSTFWKFLNIDERSEAQNIFLDSCWIYFEGSDEWFKRWTLSQMKLYWILIDAFLPRVLSSSCLKFEPNAEYGTKRHCGTYFQLTKNYQIFVPI